MNFKRLTMIPQAENNTPGQERFPDIGNLSEDDASRLCAQETAWNPKPVLIDHQKSREHVPPDREEHAAWKSKHASTDAGAQRSDAKRGMRSVENTQAKTAIVRLKAPDAQARATIFREGS